MRTFDVRPETKRLAVISIRVQYFLLALLVVGFNLWWTTSFVDSLEVKNGLALAALSVQALQQSMFLLNGIFLLSRYITDLKSITSRSQDMKVKPEVVRKLKRNIKRANNIRVNISVLNFGGVLVSVLPLAQPGWYVNASSEAKEKHVNHCLYCLYRLKYWVYLIYVFGTVFQLGSGLVICFAARRRMLRPKRRPEATSGLAADVEYMSSFVEDESSDIY